MKQLLIATNNFNKVKEISEKMQNLEISLLTINDFPECAPPVEDGETFEENAKKKAIHYANKIGVPTLADDSGLMVDALDGRPGVYSSRYANTNKERIEKLLGELKNVPEEKRGAKFVCAMVLADQYGNYDVKIGECLGEITFEPRGTQGFGYDPIFLPFGKTQTMAELSLEEKNKISHRGKALEKIIDVLRKREF